MILTLIVPYVEVGRKKFHTASSYEDDAITDHN